MLMLALLMFMGTSWGPQHPLLGDTGLRRESLSVSSQGRACPRHEGAVEVPRMGYVLLFKAAFEL